MTKASTTPNKKNKGTKAAKRKHRKIIFLLEAVVLVVLLGVLAFQFWGPKTNQSVNVDKSKIKMNEEAAIKKTGYTNVALFGVDSRQNGSFGAGTHSDCIIIASINNETGAVKLASVYRDTYLNIGDDTYNKATQAYFSGGPEQAISMLNMNLDMDITEYATVDFAAITKTVDLLGGIEIDVQEDELQHLNNYTVETSKVTGVTTTKLTHAGLQTLDGVQATSYARIRYTAGNDYKRTERQRLVIEKIIEKAKNADVGTLTKIATEVMPEISTNFKLTDLLPLLKTVSNYNVSDTTGFPFEKTTTQKIKRVGDIVVPVDLVTNVKLLHEFLYGETDYTPSNTVQAISKKIASDTGFKAEDTSSTSE